jgi:glycosyltransferase involved in cell wall biosynthesis
VKVSIITAVYNSAATVGRAIESVAAQRHCDLEHLIVEGQSTDASLAAIESARHPRLRLISESDEGIYDALNKGISAATGDVIGFVHSDDFLAHENAITRIAEEFRMPEVEAVFSDLDYVSKHDSEKVIRYWATGPYRPGCLRQGWMPAHPTLYLRRAVYERLGGYDTSFAIAADYDFILRYFSQATGKSVYIPEVLYKMRMGGVSNRNLMRIRQKMGEDYRALQRNKVGGISTLFIKNFSKLGQFVQRAVPANRS